jgi:hypothetical protein
MSVLLQTTLTAMDAILRADPAADSTARRVYGRALRTPPDRLIRLLKASEGPRTCAASAAPAPRLIRRAEAAKRLGCSLRSVDKWARAGMIRKVVLPGRTRSAGFRESDVDLLVAGDAVPSGDTVETPPATETASAHSAERLDSGGSGARRVPEVE